MNNIVMNRAKNILFAFVRVKWLKYVTVTVLAGFYVGYAGENSFYNHLRNRAEIKALEAEIAGQVARYEHDANILKQMDCDPRAVEKIARERYFMKHEDEDIFVLNTDLESAQNKNETAE